MAKKGDRAAPAPSDWTPEEKQQLQDFFDNFKSLIPDIGHEEPGFRQHGINDPRDPTLIQTPGEAIQRDKFGNELIPYPDARGGVHRPEVEEFGHVPAGPFDAIEGLHDIWGPGLANNRALAKPDSRGPLINTPLPGGHSGPLINIPLSGVPRSGMVINTPPPGRLPPGPLITSIPQAGQRGPLINTPLPGKLTIGQILALKAQTAAQAAGHPIVAGRLAA